MKVLILSFTNNKVNEDSFIPNKKGLTFACVEECINEFIDDLGTEKISNWALEKLYTIIQNRYENRLPIIITTRFNKEGLIERFSYSKDPDLVDAIISKLYQMCFGIKLKSMKKELV